MKEYPYKDSEGNECTMMQMVLREPRWAAKRIQAGEDAIHQLKNTSSNSYEKCEWKEMQDGPWVTTCQHLFEFVDGGPIDNLFTHCPYCGNSLVEVPYEEENDE